MPRPRAESPRDRILESPGAATGPALFRVAGVEPHGWSTVLIEGQDGSFYVASTATGHMTEVDENEVVRLIESRVYRRWHGDRAWTVYERLPLIAQNFGRQFISHGSEGESPI